MRIAALVLAHRYPPGISALSRFFDAADIDVFVHVDTKKDDAPFQEATKNQSRKIFFIGNRIKIFWRGFTMLEATINLLNAARLHGRYDRYLLISDDSLPLTGPAELRVKLELDIDYITARPADGGLSLRYERFFMLDSECTQVRWIPVVDREVSMAALRRFERLASLRIRGKKPLRTIYHGSQWMAVTAQSVDRILDSWESDIWLRESFEFSEVPDESYFHTILSENATPDWVPFMHTVWSVPSPPKIFKTIHEVEAIDAGDALFIRKVDFTSEELSLWIDRLIEMRGHV